MASKINSVLETSINSLLADLDAVDKEGKPKYSLLDKMRVIGAGINLEKVKKGIADSEMGSAFGDDDDEVSE